MSNSKSQWREIARHASVSTLVAVIAGLSTFAAKLVSSTQTKEFSVIAKVTLFLTLAVFVLGILKSFVDVFRAYAEKSLASKLKLEIKAQDGSVLATNLDPADVQKIAKVIEEAKGASQ
jgi:hypothetical protein